MHKLFGLLFILSVFYQFSLAQGTEIKAFKSNKAPVIDGRLNDNVWSEAIPFTDFKMVEPYPGSNPSEKTEVRIIYDKNDMYIGIRCYDGEPRKIAANTMEHDKAEEKTDDQICILLDPFQDKRNAYLFIVNPRGARSEGFATGEHFSLDWDGIWEAKSHIDGEGWSTEIKIPFKTISFNSHLTSWGINIERYIARK